MKPVLLVIVASTRPGRVGAAVGRWALECAEAHGGFEVEHVDLAALGLPFLDEPNHPKLGEYTKPHTLSWSATVERADAFLLVMPEYNHGYSAPLKNALDFLHREWAGKPVGIVSYGGIAGGTRGAQLIKPVLLSLRMIPVYEAVAVPFVSSRIGADGAFLPTAEDSRAIARTIEELAQLP